MAKLTDHWLSLTTSKSQMSLSWCPSKNLRTDFYWTNMGCVLTSQPGLWLWGWNPSSDQPRLSQKLISGAGGRNLQRGRQGIVSPKKIWCFHQKERKFILIGYQVRGTFPPHPGHASTAPTPSTPPGYAPGQGERSCLDGLPLVLLPSRSQYFPPAFVGSPLAAPESPGASVLCMWPLKPQSSDLTHIPYSLVENTDYLQNVTC